MSQPSKSKLMLIVAFVLALSAGVVVGWATSNRVPGVVPNPIPPATQPIKPEQPRGFSDQLNLTDDQRKQMQAIWDEVMSGKGKTLTDQQRELFKERDEAVEAIITSEQRTERERIKKEFGEKISEIGRERDKLVQGCVEKTKQILNESQRKRYEEMLKERDRSNRHRGGGDRGGPPRQGGSQSRPFGGGGPSSRPSMQPPMGMPFGGPPPGGPPPGPMPHDR